MRTIQRESGLLVVIELPGTPVGRVVTALAAIAQTAPMLVVIDVAGDAGGVGVMERCRRMAALAGDRGVCAQQREARDVVVEPQLGRPAGRHVAGIAAVTQLATMHVVINVTATAVCCQRFSE